MHTASTQTPAFLAPGPSPVYRPRDPRDAFLYRVVQENFQTFLRDREEEGRFVPRHVVREFESFLKCGVLAHGFMRLKCDSCEHEKLVAFSCKRRGFCSSCGARRMSEQAAFLTDWVLPDVPIRQYVLSVPVPLRFWMARDSRLLGTVLAIFIRALAGFQRGKAKQAGFKDGESGSVTLVQRFGGSANLNVHFHTLTMEGVYREEEDGKAIFHELPAPTNEEIQALLTKIQMRVVRLLLRLGKLSPDENSSPEETTAELLDLCQAASIQNKIAVGERAGERVRKIGSFGLDGEPAFYVAERCANLGGFSLHANTRVAAHKKEDLEKLCRYVARPPIAEMRLKEVADGGVIYRFKKEWSDGTTAVYFTPLEFIEKLVALIPEPRIHLTRFHGVLAPHHRFRDQIVPKKPEPKEQKLGEQQKSRDPRRLSWAELLKRIFQVDLYECPDCGGQLIFIAAILEKKVVEKILSHLGLPTVPPTFHPARPPPQRALFADV